MRFFAAASGRLFQTSTLSFPQEPTCRLHPRARLYFAFPNFKYLPPQLFQISTFPSVPCAVVDVLRSPEVDVGGWPATAVLAVVSMPKTAVNEDNLAT